MKRTTEILNKALADAKQNVKMMQGDVQKLKGNRRTLGRIVSKLVKCLRDDDHIHVSTGGHIYITMRNLPGFKSMELTMLLNTLENMGECKETRETAECLNRDYVYNVEDTRVNVWAYADEDSGACQRVQVGVEHVERPKYMIVCN